ncbi:MAG: DUF21 domain-containing protein [Pseudomonadales bacterium]|nr:DUF21 domain-containing protein [Pseudomonadales bacterium]
MDYLIALVLITLSALFSGLTLGLLTLDTQTLRRRSELGDADAARVYPVRQKGNQLLTTLLLGNVAVNSVLAVYLGSIASGVAAAITATTLIFLFGEIIPQAYFSRHALRYGAMAVPFVKTVMLIAWPIAYPIGRVLDWLLGSEIPTVYSRHELMQIISEHEDSEHSPIDADEERIVHGALRFSHLKVREVMTPLEKVVMCDENQRLTHDFFEHVTDEGYSRYPVYSGNPTNVVGILYTKDLLTEDDDIAIKDTDEAFEKDFMKVRTGAFLDALLAKMLKQKKHMAIVYNQNDQCVGVVTLEDIIEEIIQFEIEDEADDDD